MAMSEVDTQTVPALLLAWGQSAEVIQLFIDQDVTLKCLALLGREVATRLISEEGPRYMFLHHHAKWVESLDKETAKRQLDTSEDAAKLAASKKIRIASSESDPGSLQSVASTSQQSDTPLTSQPTLSSSSVPRVLILNSNEPPINDLHKELLRCPKGKIVLATYTKFKKLDDHTRNILASICIYWELGSELSKRISTKRFVELTKLIVEIFPNEASETWCEITTKKKRKIVSGRLKHKLYNVRRDFFKVNLITKVELLEELEADEELVNEAEFEDDDDILWLKGNDQPWKNVLDRWSSARVIRSHLLKRLETEEYVAYFPGLKKRSVGHELLLQDFALKYPEAEGRIVTHWPQLIEYLKSLLLKKVKGFLKTSTPPEQELVEVICNVALLFRPRNLPKPNKNKVTWRPSSTEVQNSFVLRIDEIGHLQSLLDDRKKTLADFGHTLQPLVVLVGPPNNIRQSLVVLNTQQWDCANPLAALDACYKIFFGLNTVYPAESRHIWLFIQRCVYDMETASDFSNDTGLKSYIASHIKDFKVHCEASQ